MQGPVGVVAAGGPEGEAAVEQGEELLVQDLVGLLDGGGPGEAKLLDQAVLGGLEESLDAALCLHRQLHPMWTVQHELSVSRIHSIRPPAGASRW